MFQSFVLITGIAIVLVLGVVMLLYNSLISRRNRYLKAFAQIDVQLKRRYDLIPSLVETAKGYLQHERQTLDAVVAARNRAAAAREAAVANPTAAMPELSAAEAGLTGALDRLMVLKEAYPELKADRVMVQLSEELTTTENRIAFARQAYNDAVLDYNNRREMFPGSVIAGAFRFIPAELFEVKSEAEREVVKVALP